MPGQPVKIGPFVGGMNTYSGPTSISDNEAVELLNVDIDLDGTVVSRPPLVAESGNINDKGHILGTFRSTTDVIYIVFAVGTTVKVFNTATNAFTEIATGGPFTAAVQYNDSLWLVKQPAGVATGGTKWNPVDGATAIATMPRGFSACIYKERMFISASRNNDETSINRVKFSNPADPATWGGTDYFDVAAGDGQNITKLIVFDAGIVIFKSDSTYVFAYESAPTRGQVLKVSATIGTNNNYTVIEYENNLFTMHESNVYRISNWNWEHANIKVPFKYVNQYATDIANGSSLSIVGNRLICRYFDKYYVLGLKTGAWVEWQWSKPRTNLNTNPSLETGITSWSGGAGDTLSSDSTTARSGTKSLKAVSSGGTSKQVAAISPYYGEGAIVEGENITASLYTRSATDTGYVFAQIRFHDAAGALVKTVNSNETQDRISSVWNRIHVTAPCPPTAVKVRVGALLNADVVDPTFYVDDVLIERTSELKFYMENSLGYTPAEFVGNPTIDPSSGLTKYYAISYTATNLNNYIFENRLTDSTYELFDTRVVTKAYDFGPSYAFKRLFWWGADILSKALTTFKVSPVVYSPAITWGQLVGVPMSSLNTWGRPLDTSLDVTDSAESSNPSNYRTFLKLLKGLRFRQLQFIIETALDGTTATGPMRLFSLTAFVDSKETVSKKVS